MAEGGQVGTPPASANGGGPDLGLERIGLWTKEFRRRYLAMPAAQRNRLIGAMLLIAAICAALTWYAGRTDWRILFSGLDSKDTQQIAQELSAAGIPYQLTDDSSGLKVGADQIEKARMEVATKGMPQSGRMGFELFDKPNWVGSEFDEKVNYQRALEGELEHTIGTLAVVRSARVHIVLPKDSFFSEGEQTAKASVVLQLRRSVLPPDQAEAIRGLLAGAIENLSAENVALIDADGRLNLNTAVRGATGAEVERSLEEKLVAMLEPTAGGGNVRATVNVSYEESSEEKTDEVYDPSQVAALTLHKSEQTTGDRPHPAGIPGTQSNTPGAAEQVAERPAGVPPLLQTPTTPANLPNASPVPREPSLPVYPSNGPRNGGETMTEETGSYAVTRHLLHSEHGPGQVRRVTAAVIVNDRMITEGTGKLAHAVWRPRSPEEMQRLEQLARAAIGFDATRGDQVVIENLGFSSNQPRAAPAAMERLMDQTETLIRTEPGLLKAIGLSLVTAILVMAVLRPITRKMVATLGQTPLALPAGASSQQVPALGGGSSISSFGFTGDAGELPSRLTDVQAVYQHIAEQIRKEPVQSTRLLESWISAPEEED
jgi:flagellar M-ring protein FliF